MITLTFNETDLDKALGSGSFSINEIKGRGPSRREATMLEVPGRDGAYLRRVKTPPRELEVKVTLRASSLEDLRDKVDELSDILSTDYVVPIKFSDESKTYYGFLSDTTDWSEIRNFGQGQIKFTCPDPHKYESEVYLGFTSDVALPTSGGTAETYPRFEAIALEDLTHVDFVRHDGEYMRIGRPAEMGATVFEKETLVMHDTLDSTTGWSTPTYVDNGYIAGTMSASGGSFRATAFGTGITPYSWQGPSLKRSIGAALDQFQVDVLVENLNIGQRIGMIEVYLLDANNKTVAKIGVEDVTRTTEVIQAKMQVGELGPSRVQYYRQADYVPAWNNFKGIIRLRREVVNGIYVYWPYFSLIDSNGKHVWRSSAYKYYDFKGAVTSPVTQIQVAIRKWPGVSESTMLIKDVKVWGINEEPDGIPTILKAGDELVIDHKNEDILINGESRKDLKDFGATYFSLKPGSNTVYQFPQGALDTDIYWRDKFK